MAAFPDGDLDWLRIDTAAIVSSGGVATVRPDQLADCLSWLAQERYQLERLDCGVGFAEIRQQLDLVFHWLEQFGYNLGDGSGPPNLNAVRDGFEFASPDGRTVLHLQSFDELWRLDSRWASGLLAIAAEYSRIQLATGRRFFVLLDLPDNSPLVGATFEQLTIPSASWRSSIAPPRE